MSKPTLVIRARDRPHVTREKSLAQVFPGCTRLTRPGGWVGDLIDVDCAWSLGYVPSGHVVLIPERWLVGFVVKIFVVHGHVTLIVRAAELLPQ